MWVIVFRFPDEKPNTTLHNRESSLLQIRQEQTLNIYDEVEPILWKPDLPEKSSEPSKQNPSEPEEESLENAVLSVMSDNGVQNEGQGQDVGDPVPEGEAMQKLSSFKEKKSVSFEIEEEARRSLVSMNSKGKSIHPPKQF